MTNKKLKQFRITSICREDLENKGFDTSRVDDATMKKIASKMADAYLDIGFWIDMPIIAEHYGVPRRDSKNSLKDMIKKREKEYTLSFVEEVVRNPEYKGWIAGRAEIIKPGNRSSYSIDEVRFFTPRNDEWVKFMDEYDGKDVDKAELDKVIKIIKEKFHQVVNS